MTSPKTPNFPLIDYGSNTWQLIEEVLKKQLEISIHCLCAESSHDESQKLRGRINTIRMILGWKDKEAESRQSKRM